jgi:DNA-binding response OmpR family regulator
MKKAKLLLVEDETNVLAINQEYFESKGYDIVCATTLSKARLQLEEHTPDLILLDVMMPDGTGWDFCGELRLKTNAPVIFLTCRDENESVVNGLLKGGDDYVTKPYDLNVLHARVAAQLRRSGVMSAGKIELLPLSLDLLTGEAILNGKNLYLTQKELQLLAYFVLFAGRRLSCNEIYQRAWGSLPVNASRTISVHVAKLRKKMQLDDNSCFEIKNTGKEEYIFRKVRYDI